MTTKTKPSKNNKKDGTIIQSTGQKNIEKRHSIGRVWYTASREPSDTPLGSQLLYRICTQKCSIYNSVLSGFQVSLIGSVAAPWEVLGSVQSMYNLHLVRLSRFFLFLPAFGCIFLVLHQRGHKATAPFTCYIRSQGQVRWCSSPP